MAADRKPAVSNSKPRRPPATTPEARENQMIAAAFDLAERQILEGTASSQVVTHFLKLGTERVRLEREKIARENKLLEARVENLASSARMEELYTNAIRAMSVYSGREPDEESDDY